MIEPPDNHQNLPHNVSKHYFMQYAEMMGKLLMHDDYCVMASWMITKLWYNNESNGDDKKNS